jgi:hypothetical protein
VCLNTPTFTLSGGSPTGGTYSGTGVSSGSFNPSTAGVGTHTITYTYTDGNSCTSFDTNYLIIDTVPIVLMSSLPTVCAGSPDFNLISGAPIGGVYKGIGVNSGIFSPSIAGAGIHTIRYIFTDAQNCTDSIDSLIQVNAQPLVQLPFLGGICEDDSALILTGGLPNGGTYSGAGVLGGYFDPKVAGLDSHLIRYVYTDSNMCSDSVENLIIVHRLPIVYAALLSKLCVGSQGEILSSGFPTGGYYTGTAISGDTLFPALAGTGIHTFYYHYTDTHNCSATDTSAYEVHPQPLVTAPGLGPFCAGDTGIILQTGQPANGIYRIDEDTITIFKPALLGQGMHLLQYTATDTNGCTDSTTLSVVVYAQPVVSIDSTIQSCFNDSLIILNSGLPIGGIYSGSGVSDSLFQTLLAGLGKHRIKYEFTDNNGCTDSAIMMLTVSDLPEINIKTLNPICNNIEVVELDYCTPAGGIYYGVGILGGKMYPDISGNGAVSVLYRYTDSLGCVDERTFALNVVSPEPTGFKGVVNICAGDSLKFKVSNSFKEVLWNGELGQTEKVYLPSEIRFGSNVFTLQTKDANHCISDTLILTESVNCGPEFELFPNPNNGHFTILLRTEEASDAEIFICNVLGQQTMKHVQSLNPGLNSLKIEFIPEMAGVYIVKLKWNQRTESVKIVVQ